MLGRRLKATMLKKHMRAKMLEKYKKPQGSEVTWIMLKGKKTREHPRAKMLGRVTRATKPIIRLKNKQPEKRLRANSSKGSKSKNTQTKVQRSAYKPKHPDENLGLKRARSNTKSEKRSDQNSRLRARKMLKEQNARKQNQGKKPRRSAKTKMFGSRIRSKSSEDA